MTQVFPYTSAQDRRRKLGLVALQSDESIEDDMRRLLPADVSFLVSRVPSGEDVTPESLRAMEVHLTGAAALFPRGLRFDAVGYGCTSGASQIGTARVAQLVGEGTETARVTDPVSALVAACRAAGITRLAILSPYVASVSDHLREVLRAHGIDTPVFGTFAEPNEAKVVSIDGPSIMAAATSMMEGAEVDGLFLSCTNLRTLDVIAPLEAGLALPVLSSNLVLAWHMLGGQGAPRDLL
ncbi:Asp/Glu racemase [uncultured Tateyamaria sp.]|uniref:maleate cis-trans isomerase family protein n=1 Tax=uncultured Tateyamaria sp. TaxID=455651 RepID=UPI00262B2CB6|nr:Asp/Glu racemase [uncultured Tateyamaria sp.]